MFARLVGAVVVAVLCAGCGLAAHRVGENATAGFQKQVLEIPKEQQGIVAERNGAGLVRGVFDELSEPERKAQLERMIDDAIRQSLASLARDGHSTGAPGTGGSGSGEISPDIKLIATRLAEGFADGLTARLSQQLGRDGSGPLTTALAGSSQKLASSAVVGASQTFFSGGADCEDPSSFECTQKHVRLLGEAAMGGAAKGIRWWLFGLAFLLGFMFSATVRESRFLIGSVALWLRRRRASS